MSGVGKLSMLGFLSKRNTIIKPSYWNILLVFLTIMQRLMSYLDYYPTYSFYQNNSDYFIFTGVFKGWTLLFELTFEVQLFR